MILQTLSADAYCNHLLYRPADAQATEVAFCMKVENPLDSQNRCLKDEGKVR